MGGFDVETFVHEVTEQIALAINVVAVIVVVGGVLQAIVGLSRAMMMRAATLVEKRALWLDLARWLVAGLTFQLAADIVETAVAPSWEALGRFASIAVIRTLLSYSLDHDMDTIAERQRIDTAKSSVPLPAGSDAR
jgi:uncharacterized membrane protein